MFLELLKREDVQQFLQEIVVLDTRFAKKEIPNMICEEKVSLYEYNLLVGLDAIFKYSVIVEDVTYFPTFLEQLRKILKKIENHKEISIGVSRILVQSCKEALGIKSLTPYRNKKEIVSYIYDKYIVNGYLFHSFPSIYYPSVSEDGVINQKCSIDSFQKILKKYDLSLSDRNDIAITDSPFMAFFYAYHSPYFMHEVTSFTGDESAFFRKNYLDCIKNINSFSKKNDLFPIDRNHIVSLFHEEWKNYDLDHSFPVVAMIRRSDYGRNALRDYPSLCERLKTEEVYPIVSQILDPRFNQDFLEYSLSPLAISILRLPTLEELKIKREKMGYQAPAPTVSNDLINQYGNVTIVALLGVFLITLGVTVTMIMLGGFGS